MAGAGNPVHDSSASAGYRDYRISSVSNGLNAILQIDEYKWVYEEDGFMRVSVAAC